jgi:hypothetical protein
MGHAKRSFATLTKALALAILALNIFTPPLSAQQPDANPSADQCGIYAEAYKTGSNGYNSYLKFTAEQAKTRDRNESSKRYTGAFKKSAPAASALWLNNWCTKNPLKNYAEASNRLLDELTGQTADPQSKSTTKSGEGPSSIKDSLVIMLGGDQAQTPYSCRVGKTQYCSGCSIACNEGEKATCMVGQDSYNGPKCFQEAVCRCK